MRHLDCLIPEALGGACAGVIKCIRRAGCPCDDCRDVHAVEAQLQKARLKAQQEREACALEQENLNESREAKPDGAARDLPIDGEQIDDGGRGEPPLMASTGSEASADKLPQMPEILEDAGGWSAWGQGAGVGAADGQAPPEDPATWKYNSIAGESNAAAADKARSPTRNLAEEEQGSSAVPADPEAAGEGTISQLLTSSSWKDRVAGAEALLHGASALGAGGESSLDFFRDHAASMAGAVGDSNMAAQERALDAALVYCGASPGSILETIGSHVADVAILKAFGHTKSKHKAQLLVVLLLGRLECCDAVLLLLTAACAHKQPKVAAARSHHVSWLCVCMYVMQLAPPPEKRANRQRNTDF